MNTKQLPDGLPPLPEGTYYAGTLADFQGTIGCWVCVGVGDQWDFLAMGGMRDLPDDPASKWHVALPIKAAPKQQDDGGPAFPLPSDIQPGLQDGSFGILYNHMGMSLRDWFAGKALEGTIASMSGVSIYEGKCLVSEAGGVDQFTARIAANCYKYADAMLAARKEAP